MRLIAIISTTWQSRLFSILAAACYCLVLCSQTAVGQQAIDVPKLDVRPASFKGIAPGRTTLEQVKATLGKPADEKGDEELTTLTYRIDPFPKIEIVLQKNVIGSIVIYLDAPADAKAIANELGLSKFRPATVFDEKGTQLGSVYPQRGILFSFAEAKGPDAKPNQVSLILLETITAEPFALRAEQDRGHHYQQNLADLNYAIKLGPQNAKTLALRAEVLAVVNRQSEALLDIEQAIKLQPNSNKFRLAHARLLASSGQYPLAEKLTKELLKTDKLDALTHAQAELLLGDMLADSPEHDHEQAIKHHMAAVKKAVPLAEAKDKEIRRGAKRLLVDAHLAIASDIAWGNWKKKTTVVPQWLNQAGALAGESIRNEEGDPYIRLYLYRKTLAAMNGVGGKLDPAATVKAAQSEGRNLIAAAEDPMFKRQLQWQLGETLLDAARIERTRGNTEKSLQYANAALALFRQSAPKDKTDTVGYRLMGEAYYFVGSHHATVNKKPANSIVWYEKAVAHYAHPLPQSAVGQRARRGEQLVSMGVTFWQVKKYERGLELTRRGVSLLKEAVAGGALAERTLAIPYGNLATMLRQTGSEEEAERMANLAAKIGKSADTPKRR